VGVAWSLPHFAFTSDRQTSYPKANTDYTPR
jgi:hypothetical protein